jgi:hypothetical protein
MSITYRRNVNQQGKSKGNKLPLVKACIFCSKLISEQEFQNHNCLLHPDPLMDAELRYHILQNDRQK